MSPETREAIVRRAGEWFFEQGVSTVMLFLLVAGGFYYSPKFLDAMERIGRDKDAAHSRDLKSIVSTFERDQARDERARQELEGDRQELVRRLAPRAAEAGP